VLGTPVRKHRKDRVAFFAVPFLLAGCSESSIFRPAGPIGDADRTILLDALVIMLFIVIPTMFATVLFAWRFRASNDKAPHLPRWAYSGRVELVVWSIPALVVLFLGGVAWIGSHDLDPASPLSAAKPLDVDVVSLDWKWLYVYPQERVASINRLVIPVDRPVRFRITSATVFNSFFVPRLGSQIYAMNGMVTQLNLMARQPGTYHGLSAQFSGDGFSDMGFFVDAVPEPRFAQWVALARASGPVLDKNAYRALLSQSIVQKPYTYRDVTPRLFDLVVTQVLPPGRGPAAKSETSTPP
jgi:cytochrome o ubiquinol oxidase subunit II